MSDLSSLENDLRAIEAVSQRDVEAALAGDTATMMSQWTDDFVLLQPEGPRRWCAPAARESACLPTTSDAPSTTALLFRYRDEPPVS